MANTKLNRNIRILLCGIIVLSTVLCCLYITKERDNAQINPINGMLDMQSWDAVNDGIITLNGEWKFYWKQLVDYDQIDSECMIVQAPSVWKDYAGTGGSGFGYGTYALNVKNAKALTPLSLRIPSMSTAYEL